MQDVNTKVLQSLLLDGIRLKSLTLASFPETGRGLGATAKIRPEEVLMTIPARHLLNLKTIGKDLGLDWKKWVNIYFHRIL
jgi:hypothetical protein